MPQTVAFSLPAAVPAAAAAASRNSSVTWKVRTDGAGTYRL
jgi:hypothetical protein